MTLEEMKKRLADLEELETLTEEQRAEKIKLEADISDAEFMERMSGVVGKAVDSAIADVKKELKPSTPQLYDASGRGVGGDLSTGTDMIPQWTKRVGAYFNAAVAHGQDRIDDMKKHKNRFKDLSEEATEAMLDAERAEARAIIERSNMNKIAKVRALSTLTGAEGEFLLPKPFLAEIFVIIEERGVARNSFRGVPMGSKDLDLKDVATKPTVFWTNEAADIGDTQPAFGEGKLDTNKLAALTPWTAELAEDEVFGMMSILQELLAEAILEAEDTAGFVGDGTASTGGFTGLFNLTNAAEFTMAAGKTSFGDADADDFKSVRDQLTLARRRGAVWYMHPDIVSNLEGLKGSDGQYIYRQPSEARPATLWGFPITQVEVAPGEADDGIETRFAVLGNPSWMLFGTRRGMTLMTSMEGAITDGNNVTFNALTNDGAILRITERIGFKAAIENAYATLKTAAA